MPITRTDAAYVQIIHSDSGRLGMESRIGTIDFYPNGGSHHPGCGEETYSPMLEFDLVKCNHARAWHFYQQSVRQPQSMPAVRCLSWDDFLDVENGTCYRDDIVYMGFGADTKWDLKKMQGFWIEFTFPLQRNRKIFSGKSCRLFQFGKRNGRHRSQQNSSFSFDHSFVC